MLSPWFDRSFPGRQRPTTDGNPPRLLLILAPPRAGSFHLARLLWEMGCGCPTEYFNRNPLYRSLLRRWGELSRWQRWLGKVQGDRQWIQQNWLSQLVKERWNCCRLTGTPFFSSKLQPFQLPGRFERIWPRLQQNMLQAGCLSQGDASLVLLLRRNWQASVASLHLARCTGAYDLGLTPTFQHLPASALLEPTAIQQTAALYHHHLRWLQDANRVSSPLVLHHEDLLSEQANTLWRLLLHCDPALRERTSEGAPPQDWHAALNLTIQRDASPWATERRDWLQRIGHVLQQLEATGEISLATDQPLLHWLSGAAADPTPAD